MVTSNFRTRGRAIAALGLSAAMIGLIAVPASARPVAARASSGAVFAATATGATLTYPVDGQTNVATARPFTWSTVPASQGTILVIGTTKFGTNLVNSGVLPASRTSYLVPALPAAKTLYATLLTKVGGAWTRYDAITFTAGLPADLFTYPVDGQTGVATTRAFTWSTLAGSQNEILVIGTTKFGTSLIDSGLLPPAQTSYSASLLPGGKTLYATLLTEVGGAWTRYDAISFTTAAQQAHGSLDPSFGTDGQVTVDAAQSTPISIGYVAATGESLVGVLAFAGANGVDSIVERLSSTGVIDSTFGSGGIAHLPPKMAVRQVQDAGAGRVLAVGVPASGAQSGLGTEIVRLTATGTLDTSFGAAGVVIIASGESTSAVVAPDGRIFVSLDSFTGTATSELEIAAFTSAGLLDSTFGSAGLASTTLGKEANAAGIAIQPNGDLVVIGGVATQGNPSAAIAARFLPTGQPDTTFGEHGVFTQLFGPGDFMNRIAVAPNGDLVIAGIEFLPHGGAGLIAELTPAGTLNTAFGTGGVIFENPTPTDQTIFQAVAVSADNEIYGLLMEGQGPFNGSLRRYTADGQPDPIFGTAGEVYLPGVIPLDLTLAYRGRPEVTLEIPPTSASVVAERFFT